MNRVKKTARKWQSQRAAVLAMRERERQARKARRNPGAKAR